MAIFIFKQWSFYFFWKSTESWSESFLLVWFVVSGLCCVCSGGRLWDFWLRETWPKEDENSGAESKNERNPALPQSSGEKDQSVLCRLFLIMVKKNACSLNKRNQFISRWKIEWSELHSYLVLSWFWRPHRRFRDGWMR